MNAFNLNTVAAPKKVTRKPSLLRDSQVVKDFKASLPVLFGGKGLAEKDKHYLLGVSTGIKLGSNLGRKRSEATYIAIGRVLGGNIPANEKAEDIVGIALSHSKRKSKPKKV